MRGLRVEEAFASQGPSQRLTAGMISARNIPAAGMATYSTVSHLLSR